MKIFTFLVFSFFILPIVSAQPDTLSVSEVFILLPDSVFYKDHSPFTKEKPLIVEKRNFLLLHGDSIMKNEAGEDIMENFRVEKDDNKTLIISNLTGRSISLAIWKLKNKNLIVGVIHKKCDFVMCFNSMDFYEYDGKIFTEKKLVGPTVELKHFFPIAEMKRCNFKEDDMMYRVVFSFGEERIYFYMQDEMLDSELMGFDSEFICLDLNKKYLKEYFYEWDGKKFKMVTLKMSTD